MLTLDGYDLSRLELRRGSRVELERRTSLGGRDLLSSRTMQQQDLDIVGGAGWGWLDRATFEELRGQLETPGTALELVHDSGAYTVRGRIEDGRPVTGDHVRPYPVEADGDRIHNVLIMLRTV